MVNVMTPNLNIIKPVFLPLTFICLGIFLDQMSAKAELTNTNAIQNQISPSSMVPAVGSGIDVQTEPQLIGHSVKLPAQAILNPAIQRKASLLGNSLILTDRSVTTEPSEATAPISQAAPNSTIPIQPLAQAVVSPGRSTQSGSSYVGIGGNIGIGTGDTALGRGGFTVISKIGLTQNFSVRPSILFGDSTTILLPVTYDFNFGEGPTGDFGFRAAPYLGAGASISTGNDTKVGLLLTGGIDVPLSSQFTATAALNASVTGNTAVGILVGVGYNFR